MKLLAIDGTNVVMRYACAMLGEGRADPSPEDEARVLRGVEAAIRECARNLDACRAVIALDAPADTWRHGIYPAYKANREKGSTGGWSKRLHDDFSERGWLCLCVPGFEADDILATFAVRAAGIGFGVAILSSDSDLLQLVFPGAVEVYQFGRKDEARFVSRSAEWIAQHYGIASPQQLGLLKALVGEPGDNLPGVRHIGPVNARKIICDNPTARDISAALVGERRAAFELMLRLVTLRDDAPIRQLTAAECRIP